MSRKRVMSVSEALTAQAAELRNYAQWFEKSMSTSFFAGVDPTIFPLIVEMLGASEHFGKFIHLNLNNYAVVLSLESPGQDVEILKYYDDEGIQDYKSYISESNFYGRDKRLQITVLSFTSMAKDTVVPRDIIVESVEEVIEFGKSIPTPMEVNRGECIEIFGKMSKRFFNVISVEQRLRSYELYKNVKVTHRCQYWDMEPTLTEKGEIEFCCGFAWENAPKHHFMYRLSEICSSHNLDIVQSYITYMDPLKSDGVLMSWFLLRGAKINKNLPIGMDVDRNDFIQEVVTVKSFPHEGILKEKLMRKGLITGNESNLLHAIAVFIECAMTNVSDLYVLEFIKKSMAIHSDLTTELLKVFKLRFHPNLSDDVKYERARETCLADIDRLDTGYPKMDRRRRNVFKMGLVMIEHVLKTNCYLMGKIAIGFRLDTRYLDHIPDFDRTEVYPELPFGIFFIVGLDYFAFQIRFRDLARGGMRTVVTRDEEHSSQERGTIFGEIYNLAYTQQKKNKDIPEGGSKAIIFLEPDKILDYNVKIVKNELRLEGIEDEEAKRILDEYNRDQKREHIFQSQRSFVKTLISLVNHKDGKLIEHNGKYIIDRYGMMENIYMGPDENCSNETIKWIANFSRRKNYEPSTAFISAKEVGINHKEFGVTSLGVFQYLLNGLRYLGIEPSKDNFTVKITGGPDGDVAGNMMLLLEEHCKDTAKLLAVKDGFGSCYDPLGLDLETLVQMFYKGEAIDHYPPEKLHNGGFLLKIRETKWRDHHHKEVLCFNKSNGLVIEEWMGASAANKLYNRHLHSVEVDAFIPSGGRPRTLHQDNYEELLDSSTHKPTCKLIVEGANLYLTEEARNNLEDIGVLIFKDASANKGGVISSSYEIIAGLCLTDEEFLENKIDYVKEVKERISSLANLEAKVMLDYFKIHGGRLTEISEKLSGKINFFFDQFFSSIKDIVLKRDRNFPMNRLIFDHCPKVLEEKFPEKLLAIPDSHKKAIIAVVLACKFVYERGIDWAPSVSDIMPLMFKDMNEFSTEEFTYQN